MLGGRKHISLYGELLVLIIFAAARPRTAVSRAGKQPQFAATTLIKQHTVEEQQWI